MLDNIDCSPISDAVSVYGVGMSGAADEEVRKFAIEAGRVLVTLDADFANIHRFSPRDTPGVVRLKIHPPTEAAIAALLHSVLSSHRRRSFTCVLDEIAYCDSRTGGSKGGEYHTD